MVGFTLEARRHARALRHHVCAGPQALHLKCLICHALRPCPRECVSRASVDAASVTFAGRLSAHSFCCAPRAKRSVPCAPHPRAHPPLQMEYNEHTFRAHKVFVTWGISSTPWPPLNERAQCKTNAPCSPSVNLAVCTEFQSVCRVHQLNPWERRKSPDQSYVPTGLCVHCVLGPRPTPPRRTPIFVQVNLIGPHLEMAEADAEAHKSTPRIENSFGGTSCPLQLKFTPLRSRSKTSQ